jgi:hypothetical protein
MFDTFAMWGHIINNSIIMILSVYVNVSFFMAFNILCLCIFYASSSRKLNYKANKNATDSGIQSQCDLKMAQLITKRYKNDSFYEWLKIRNGVWNF